MEIRLKLSRKFLFFESEAICFYINNDGYFKEYHKQQHPIVLGKKHGVVFDD